MKKSEFSDIILYYILICAGVIIRLMPARAVLFLGRRLGRLICLFYKKRKTIAYGNLKSVFSGSMPPGELSRMTGRVFEHFACVLLEMFKFPQIDEKYARENISDSGFEHLGAAIRRGRGAIVLTGHFGNWELSSLIAALKGFKQDLLARQQKHARLNGLLNSYRQIRQRRVITKGVATRHLIRALRENHTIAILADQDAGANGFLVRFFNRLTSTAPGAIIFAAKFDAPVLPNFCVRINGPKYKLTIEEPMKLTPPADKKEESFNIAVAQNLQKFADTLQGYVENHPEQWLWMHKRWKSSPSRKALILTDGKAGHLEQARSVAWQIRRLVTERAQKDPRVELFRKVAAREGKGPHAQDGLLYSRQEAKVEFKSGFRKLLLGACALFASRRCQGCLRCLKFCLTEASYDEIVSASGQIVVSCGSSASIAARFIAKENNAKSVAVMKPSFLPAGFYDLCIVPRHDNFGRARAGIVRTYGALNTLDDESLKKSAAELKNYMPAASVPAGPVLGVLLGGSTKNIKISIEFIKSIIEGVFLAAEYADAGLLVTTSRRTAPDTELFLKRNLSANPRCKLLIIANEKNIPGAVPGILGLSDLVVLSPDSVSMISEAASSGKKVIVAALPQVSGNKRLKHNRFLSMMDRERFITLAAAEKLFGAIKEKLSDPKPALKLDDTQPVYEALKRIV